MEQKMNATAYLMDMISEMGEAKKELEKAISDVNSERTWAKAAAQWHHVKGMLTGIYWVINNMQECPSNEVLQDMAEEMEQYMADRQEALMVMKSGYIKEVQS